MKTLPSINMMIQNNIKSLFECRHCNKGALPGHMPWNKKISFCRRLRVTLAGTFLGLWVFLSSSLYLFLSILETERADQGLVKGAILWFRNPYFYFQHGESTSTASQLSSPASQKSKDLNKVPLLLQDLEHCTVEPKIFYQRWKIEMVYKRKSSGRIEISQGFLLLNKFCLKVILGSSIIHVIMHRF